MISNGNIYEGEYVNGTPEGYGTLINNGMIKFEGEWKHGQLHGTVIVDKGTKDQKI